MSAKASRGILHVITSFGTGGAETMLGQVAPALAARGLPQHVVSLTGGGPLGEKLERAGVPVTTVDLQRTGAIPAEMLRLGRLVRRLEPAAIQGWMYHGDLVATLVRAWSRQPRPALLWGIRCSNMDLSAYRLQLRLVVRACAALSRVPDVVTANSEAGARVHLDSGYRPRRLVVMPNGIDVERFRPDPDRRARMRAMLGIGADEPVALHVARVDPMKDHALFLRAIGRLPHVRAILAGAGTDRLTGLPANVLALGRRDDVPDLMAASDLIVSSSAWGEGFPNVLGEGMSAGLVPVATDVGDSRMIIDETGRVVPPHDEGALAAAIGEIVALGPARADLSRAARERVVSLFSLRACVDRYERLYRDVL